MESKIFAKPGAGKGGGAQVNNEAYALEGKYLFALQSRHISLLCNNVHYYIHPFTVDRRLAVNESSYLACA